MTRPHPWSQTETDLFVFPCQPPSHDTRHRRPTPSHVGPGFRVTTCASFPVVRVLPWCRTRLLSALVSVLLQDAYRRSLCLLHGRRLPRPSGGRSVGEQLPTHQCHHRGWEVPNSRLLTVPVRTRRRSSVTIISLSGRISGLWSRSHTLQSLFCQRHRFRTTTCSVCHRGSPSPPVGLPRVNCLVFFPVVLSHW